MNETGCGHNVTAGGSPPKLIKIRGQEVYYREYALALGSNYEEYYNLILPENDDHAVTIAGYDTDGNKRLGIMRRGTGTLNDMTPANPFYIEQNEASKGSALLEDTSNWFHGDPDRLEVRDAAYCWHRFNTSADYSFILVPMHKIFWCTAAQNNASPFIPFDLNDPYVHPAFEDYSYYELADYSQNEIDAIEDAIMAIDGAVIGDVRTIQQRIVEGWFNFTGLEIVSTSLLIGFTGEAYHAALQTKGSNPSYNWRIVSGSLPDGLSLDGNGEITGTPYLEETRIFTVEVSDANQSTDTRELSITIYASGTVILEAYFDIGTDGFVYYDDPFRNADEPDYAEGKWESQAGYDGGALRVELGGKNDDDVTNMSGGWQFDFYLDAPKDIMLSFYYKLSQTPEYESDEYSEVLMSIDGNLHGKSPDDYIAMIKGNGNRGISETTQWQSIEINIGLLETGSHRLIIGGYNNKKTYHNESTEVLIDNVILKQLGSQSSIPLQNGRMIQQDSDDDNKNPRFEIPGSFSLYQNYPNPFNPSTTIAFDLYFDAKVKISILNTMGQLVTTLANGDFQVGSHTITWNALNETGKLLPSGVYIYKIEVNELSNSIDKQNSFVASEKMILTK